MEKQPSEIKPESWLVSAGRAAEPGTPLSVPPIPASNFIIGSGREYARDDGTPTWEAFEEVVGGLESGKAVAFASGMAAISCRPRREKPRVRRMYVPGLGFRRMKTLAASASHQRSLSWKRPMKRFRIQRCAGSDSNRRLQCSDTVKALRGSSAGSTA
jgi:hypothetical protein